MIFPTIEFKNIINQSFLGQLVKGTSLIRKRLLDERRSPNS